MEPKTRAMLRHVLLAGVSLAGVSCVATTPATKQVARVCDPIHDTACHPTKDVKVVVK